MPIEIRDEDVYLQVRIGNRVRRALIRHFTAFLKAKIAERGYSVDDPLLFDQDMLEDKAWELAEGVIADVEGIHEVVEAMGGDASPAAYVRDALTEALDEAEREFLNDRLGGLDLLIEVASGHFPEIR